MNSLEMNLAKNQYNQNTSDEMSFPLTSGRPVFHSGSLKRHQRTGHLSIVRRCTDRFAPSCSKEDRREVERILVSCMHDKEATETDVLVGWLDGSMFVFFWVGG